MNWHSQDNQSPPRPSRRRRQRRIPRPADGRSGCPCAAACAARPGPPAGSRRSPACGDPLRSPAAAASGAAPARTNPKPSAPSATSRRACAQAPHRHAATVITPDRRVQLDLRDPRHDQRLSPGASRCCPDKNPGASQTPRQATSLLLDKATQGIAQGPSPRAREAMSRTRPPHTSRETIPGRGEQPGTSHCGPRCRNDPRTRREHPNQLRRPSPRGGVRRHGWC